MFVLLTSSALACAPTEVKVVAIANEGFLITSGRHTVLIDALFRATGPYPDFFQEAPSEDLLQGMITGDGEFAHVDLALASHVHHDHFNAEIARAFLARHRETVLVGTDGVAAALAGLPGFDEIAERVVVPIRTRGSCRQAEIKGVDVTACLVPHAGGGDPDNLVFVVDLDGFRFLHEGDADMTPTAFRGLDLGEGGLDLCFMHGWYAYGGGCGIVTELLRPRELVLMHHRWVQAPQEREQVEHVRSGTAAKLPPVTVFAAELERKTFRIR
jgi:L-ascorbate metabolism protein UlaG (beta-lactamase superfamily)